MRPDGRLVVLSYPDVLPNPDDPGDYQKNSGYCFGVDTVFSNDELRRVYEAARQINQMVSLAVAQVGDPRVQFVDNLNAFVGHRVCAPDNIRWAAGISLSITSDTFHPNEAGYGQMARQIRSQTGIG